MTGDGNLMRFKDGTQQPKELGGGGPRVVAITNVAMPVPDEGEPEVAIERRELPQTGYCGPRTSRPATVRRAARRTPPRARRASA